MLPAVYNMKTVIGIERERKKHRVVGTQMGGENIEKEKQAHFFR